MPYTVYVYGILTFYRKIKGDSDERYDRKAS